MGELRELANDLLGKEIMGKFKAPFPEKFHTQSFGGFVTFSHYKWQNLKPWLMELSQLLNMELVANEVKYLLVCYFLSRY